MTIDSQRLQEFVGKMVDELGASVNAPLVLIGDKLGLYGAIADRPGLNISQLAASKNLSERYIREWVFAQVASGYIDYEAETQTVRMSPEQIAVFADEDSPTYMMGAFYSLSAIFNSEPQITEAFRSGEGIGWGDHSECLFCGTAKFFRSSYKNYLTSEWLVALDGAIEKLEKGAKVADIGCGHGCSTVAMAEAFPNSQFWGFDFHEPSVEAAKQQARDKGLDNVQFEVATAKNYPGNQYDLVAFFDCLHDMGDPVGALHYVRQTMSPDGTLLLVEPFAGDRPEDNFNPVGRMMYGFSTSVCIPSSLSQEVGMALGTQAGERRLKEVVESGGFRQFRKAHETPFNLILEAKV